MERTASPFACKQTPTPGRYPETPFRHAKGEAGLHEEHERSAEKQPADVDALDAGHGSRE